MSHAAGAHPLAQAAADGARVAGLRVGTYAIGFLASTLIARALGPEGKGLYTLPAVAAGIAVTLGAAGLEHAHVHLAARGVPLPTLWANASVAAGALGALCWVVAAVIWAVAPGVFGGVPVAWVVAAMGLVPVLLGNLFRWNLLQLDHRVVTAARATVAGVAAHVVVVAGLVAAHALTPFRVVALMWLANGVTWLLLRRAGGRAGLRGAAVCGRDLRRALAFGLRAHAGIVFVFLLFRVDQVMVGRMLGFEALGIYALAVALAEVLWIASDPIAQALLPHQVRAGASRDRALASEAARVCLLVAATGGVVAWLAAPWAVELLYGPAFAGAVWPFRLLLPGVAIFAGYRPMHAVLLKEGRPVLASVLGGGALLANVVLNLVLVPEMGVAGASIGSSVAYGGLVLAYAAITRGPDAGWAALLPRPSDVALLASGMRRRRADGPARVVLVVGTLERGGTEGQVVRLAGGLAGRGCAVTILCLAHAGELGEAARRAGAEVVEARFAGAKNPVAAASCFLRVVRMLRERRPDVVQCFLYWSELIGIPAARLARVPVVVSSRRSLRTARGARRMLRPLEVLATRWSDAIVCNAEAVRADAVEDRVPSRKTVVIPNATDVAAGWTAPQAPDEVLCVANLIAYKGHDVLLEAWARVRDRLGPRTLRLVLAGAGPEEPRLRALTVRLAIGDEVAFLGSVDDVRARLARCSFTVLASRSEGSPNAVLESLAAGRGVVATDVGGVRELVGDDAGILVPPDDPGALADAIVAMAAAGSAERYGRAALAAAERRHTTDAMTGAYLEVYAR